ncbi:MAG TPA: sulfatase-like hydrolase/transferase [Terriglobales bacterium]|nr:sulfatase-like hydrolase/transferase [Terriglobales bacterium]
MSDDVRQSSSQKIAEARPWRDWLAVLGAYVVLPNLPFFIAARFIFLERAVINLDYIVLGLLSPLFPKALNLFLFAVAFFLDILFSTSGIYHFPVADALRALHSVGDVSMGVTVPVFLLALLAVYAVVRAATQWRRIGRNSSTYELAAILLLLIAVDLVASRWLGDDRFQIARSSVGKTAVAAAGDFRPLDLKPEDFWRAESATQSFNKDIDAGNLAGEDVVLVVVESLGQPVDPAIASWLEEPLLSEEVQSRYQVRKGTVEFNGSTVFGELRELCGIRGVGMRMTELKPAQTASCLPSKLNANGYQTVSVHGVTSAMFRRKSWYPTLGFQRMIFPEDWPRKNANVCNAQFHGICDADGAEVVHDELRAATRPTFVYWLTVESHLQLDDAAIGRPAGDCKGLAADVCWMVLKQRSVLAEIARIALDPALKPTRFVVVGDHSPPYMVRKRRDLFADRRVPWVELRPRK